MSQPLSLQLVMRRSERVGWIDGTEIGRRYDPDRLPGWTLELVIEYGLGERIRSNGATHIVQLDGRSSGPVFFMLTNPEFLVWREARAARLSREGFRQAAD